MTGVAAVGRVWSRLFGRAWVRWTVGSALALAVLTVVGANLLIRLSTSDRVRSLDEVPTEPVAIVLGAGLNGDGSPKPYLEERLRGAATLYERGTVRAILVSGDHGTVEHDEVAAMTDWLVAHGVPAHQVVGDHAGFDTYDSCVRAHTIFGVRAAIVVTQGFHVRRAVYLCQQAGIDTYGVAAATPDNPLRYEVREVPAAVKAVWDSVTEPDPRYLGRHETGIDDALSD